MRLHASTTTEHAIRFDRPPQRVNFSTVSMLTACFVIASLASCRQFGPLSSSPRRVSYNGWRQRLQVGGEAREERRQDGEGSWIISPSLAAGGALAPPPPRASASLPPSSSRSPFRRSGCSPSPRALVCVSRASRRRARSSARSRRSRCASARRLAKR